ncbi:MAG: FCD domain-containing protein [Corynebacterium sp.]|nr:FCD domain-containing protein [Corynebacterium sp.]
MSNPQGATHGAVEAIENYIRDHRLKAGDLLPSESELCEILGLSRSPVREAMRILAALDIVQVRRGFGTVVSTLSLKPLIAGLTLRVSLDQEHSATHLLQIVSTREALEKSVAGELVTAHTSESLAAMRDIVSEMLDSYLSTGYYAHHDRRFHTAMLEPIENELIRELCDALWQVHGTVLPLLKLPASEELERTVRSHYVLVDAIAGGDPTVVRDAIRDHYRPLRSVVSALI